MCSRQSCLKNIPGGGVFGDDLTVTVTVENLSQNTTDKTEQSVHESEKAQMDDTVTPSRTAKAAGSTVTVDGLKYNILTMPDGGENGTVAVGVNQSYNGSDLSIPPAITVDNDPDNNGRYDVVQIINGAFWSNQNLTGTLIIPTNVTSIGGQAFQNCSNITELRIVSARNLTIAEYAFSGCSSLESVSFPDSLQSIGKYAFEACRSLKSVTFPKNLQSIRNSAFMDCSNLESVSLPSNYKPLRRMRFLAATSLPVLPSHKVCNPLESMRFRTAKPLQACLSLVICTPLKLVPLWTVKALKA